jgi:hypothetical protein
MSNATGKIPPHFRLRSRLTGGKLVRYTAERADKQEVTTHMNRSNRSLLLGLLLVALIILKGL